MDVLDRTSSPDPDTVPYKHLAIRYGAIWAGASILTTLVGYLTDTDPMLPTTGAAIKGIYTLIGIGVMVWAIVMAIRTDRDQQLGGFIGLGRCVGIGALTGLVTGVIGGIFLLIYLNFINTGFEMELKNFTIEQYTANGMSEDDAEKAYNVASFLTGPIAMTIWQIVGDVFMGTITGLIAGLFMKREAYPSV